MRFSEQQKKAIFTGDKNILVSAAAGSGKTAVLVQRVIELIKEGTDVDRLLIVTFTRAAAAEMMARIEKELKALLLTDFENKSHIRRQLRLLGRAEITTIDSFCTRLLRRYFYRTDIDPNFSTGAESTLTSLRAEAIENVISKAFEEFDKGNSFYKPLYDLCDMVSSGSTSEIELEKEIINIYKSLSALPYPKKFLRKTLHKLKIGSYEEYLESEYCKIIRDSLGIDEAYEQTFKADKILRDYFENYVLEKEVSYLDELRKEKEINNFLYKLKDCKFPTLRNSKRKLDPYMSDKAKELRNSAKEIIKSAVSSAELLSEESYLKYKKSLPMVELFYKLVEDFTDEYDRLKAKRNLYEFSDIERAALYMLVKEDGKATELAQELKNYYKEIITDEYQDTSPLQEEILNAVARENNRFMVGDIKQSIYAFRNADPSIFVEKYNRYEAGQEDCELIRLSENYRSRKHILDFVNLVFSQIMSEDLGGVVYEPLNYPENSKYESSELSTFKTEICVVNNTLKPEPPEENDEIKILRELAEDDGAIETVAIAEKIRQLMDENKDINYGDIAILSLRLKGISESIIDTLAKCGIPAVTDKDTDSTNFIENKVIISLLKVIDNPLSDINLLSVLHSPIYRFDTEELSRIRLSCDDRDIPFYDVAVKYCENFNDDISAKFQKFMADMEYFSKEFKNEPVSTVLTEIYNRTQYYNYINILSDSEKRRANLEKLFDYAAEYDKTGEGGLYGFLNYLQDIINADEFRQAQIVRSENNAVHIMTIHGSKGLQFPVVFLFGVNRKFRKISGKIIFDPDLGICMYDFDGNDRVLYNTLPYQAAKFNKNRAQAAELMRLYYVAMTRAEERLYITCTDKDYARKNIKNYDEQIQGLFDKYLKHSEDGFGKISAESVYNSNDFLSVLTNAVSRCFTSETFDFEIKNWFELVGNIVNMNPEIFRKELDTKEPELVDYAYKDAVYLPTNLSVTEIKKRMGEETYSIDYGNEEFIFKKPRFITEEKNYLTPAETGTAYHALLSFIDYKNLPTDIDDFKNSAIERGILDEREAAAIDNNKILTYLRSDLVKKIACSDRIMKEHSFTMGLNAYELYPELGLGSEAGQEIILTHGVIDLYYENEDGIVIVDFKTDRTTDFDKLRKMYKPQLEIYKLAVESAVNKKVVFKCLYLINCGKTLYL